MSSNLSKSKSTIAPVKCNSSFNKYLFNYQLTVFISKLSDEKCKKPRSDSTEYTPVFHTPLIETEKGNFDISREDQFFEILPYFPYDISVINNQISENSPYLQFIIVNEMFLFIDEYIKLLTKMLHKKLMQQKDQTFFIFMEHFTSLFFLFKIFSSVELDKYEKNVGYKIMKIFKIIKKIFKCLNTSMFKFNKTFKNVKGLTPPEIKFDVVLQKLLYEQTIDFLIDISFIKNEEPGVVGKLFKKSHSGKNYVIEFVIKHVSVLNDVNDIPLHDFLIGNLRSILRLKIFSTMKFEFIETILNSFNYSHTFSENNSAVFSNLMSYQNTELFLNWKAYQQIYKTLFGKAYLIKTLKHRQKVNLYIPMPLISETAVLPELSSYQLKEFSQKQINLIHFEEQFSSKFFYKSFIQVTKLKSQLIEFFRLALKRKNEIYMTLLYIKLSPHAASAIAIEEVIINDMPTNPSYMFRIVNKIVFLEKANLLSSSYLCISKIFTNMTENLLGKTLMALSKTCEVRLTKKISIGDCEKCTYVGISLRTLYLLIDKNMVLKSIIKKQNKKELKHFLHTYNIHGSLCKREMSEINKPKYSNIRTYIFTSKTKTFSERCPNNDYAETDGGDIKPDIIKDNSDGSNFTIKLLLTFRRIMSTFACPVDGNDVNYLLGAIGEVFAEKILFLCVEFEKKENECYVCTLENEPKEEYCIFNLIKSSCYVVVYSFLTLNMDMHSQLSKSRKSKKSVHSYVKLMSEVETINNLKSRLSEHESIQDMERLIKLINLVFNPKTYSAFYESIKSEEIKYREFDLSFYEILDLETEIYNFQLKYKTCVFCLNQIFLSYHQQKPTNEFKVSSIEKPIKNEICEACLKLGIKRFTNKFYESKTNKTDLLIENFKLSGKLEDLINFVNEFHASDRPERILSDYQIKKIFQEAAEEQHSFQRSGYGTEEPVSANIVVFIETCFLFYRGSLKNHGFIEKNLASVLQIIDSKIKKNTDLFINKTSLFNTIALIEYTVDSNIEQIINFYIRIVEIIFEYNQEKVVYFYLECLEVYKDTENKNILHALFKIYSLCQKNALMQKSIKKIFLKSSTLHLYFICNSKLESSFDIEAHFQYLDNSSKLIADNFLTENEKHILLVFMLEKSINVVHKGINSYQIFLKNCFEYIFDEKINYKRNLLLEIYFLKSTFLAVLNYERHTVEQLKDNNYIRLLKQFLYFTSLITRNSDMLNVFLKFLFSFEGDSLFINSLSKVHALRICLRNILKYELNINYLNDPDLFGGVLKNTNFRFPDIVYFFINKTAEEMMELFWKSDPLILIRSISEDLEANNSMNVELSDFRRFIQRGPISEESNFESNAIDL
ncbi:hypothetical protein CDIK_0021 [Cucumispora dikerogammari]|nr:hypothetical protein CDIK_0021 [Cucumispora dikerogammari]